MLYYAFSKTGSAEAGFEDTVEIRIHAADSAKRVSVAFLTGARSIVFPEVAHAEGNPVLLYFLEREIREMARLTGAKPAQFRRAIRTALARSARVAKTKLGFGGRSSPASEVTIIPYAENPLRDSLGKHASKTYVFTLSDDVPGGIYRVRGFVPPPTDAANDAPPLIEERLSFVGIKAR
jgi:hypothetical protein